MIAILIKSLILGTVFTAYYWAFLRNRKLHKFNRYYIVVSMLAIVVLPFCQLDFGLSAWIDRPAMPGYFQDVQGEVLPGSYHSPALESYFAIGFSIGAFILLSLFISRVLAVFQLKNRFEFTRENGYDFIRTNLDRAPFTFFNNLFWRTDISLQEDSGIAVFNHEIAHIKGRHSLDQMLSHILACLFWINPFLWVLRKELLVVHEFLADSESVPEGDTDSFARLVLTSVEMATVSYPVHCFFGSTMKRRLAMIGKIRKTSYSSLRKLLIVPIGLIAVALAIAEPGCAEKELSASVCPDFSATAQTVATSDSVYRQVSFINAHGVQDRIRKNVIFQASGGRPKQEKIFNLDLIDVDIVAVKSDGTTEIIKSKDRRKS